MKKYSKNLIIPFLLLLLSQLLCSMEYTQDILFPHLASLPDTPNKTTLHSQAINLCKPPIFPFAKDYDFGNIAHLDLHINGPFSLHYTLKAPTFSLQVNGPLLLGKSNEEMGIIAATHGPLNVSAHTIDARYGKFYGKGPTHIESTIGDITIGAPMRGIDKNLEEQWGKGSSHYSQYFLINNRLAALLGARGYQPKPMNLNFDCTLNTRNGAYIASDSSLMITSATDVLLQYSRLKSSNDMQITAVHQIQNHAGEISSHQNISLLAKVYNHTRDGVVNKLRSLGYDYAQYFGSQPATLAALHNIYIKISDKVYNFAGSMRSGGNISINESPLVANKHPHYIEEPQKFYIHGNYTAGYGCEETYTQPCTTQAGDTITMNLGDFTITGNMNAGTIAVKGDTGAFINTDPLRTTIISTEPTFVNVTQHAQEEAQKSGFYQLAADGSIQTEFPLGTPSRVDPNHMVVLQNNQPTPQLWQNIFNPLSSINLDLLLQRLISNHTGKTYNTHGQNISSVLRENAHQWQQKNQKTIMSPDDVQHINESMLLSQIVSTSEDELQQHTLLCIAPQDINPYQSSGDIVADTFSSITQNNQTHLNNRIIGAGNLGITLESTTGKIHLETQSYTVTTSIENSTITEQKAMPQQQLIAPSGPIFVHAHSDISRIGTVMAAGTNIVEQSDHGTITKKPLILQKKVETHCTKKGFFSSTHKTETSITHSAMPCETHSSALLHNKADRAINMTASRDSAQQAIIYDAPHISIEGLLLANSFTSTEEKNGMFTDEIRKSSQQTPYALAAHTQAPIVRFVGEDARVNANIYATELHDETEKGIQFVAKVAQMLCSGQTLISSPLSSIDSGFEAGYETMIPPMLMVEKIIRLQNNGCMLFESTIMDKNRTKIIGTFVEKTYHLKQWQRNWHHTSQLIPDEALVIIALAITLYTQGMGVELLQPLLNNVTAATGMQLSAAGIAAVDAGLSAIYSSATTSFLKTGDPIHTAKHLVSPTHLQSLSLTMASAGLCSQLGSMLNINMEPGIKTFSEHLQQHALQSAVDTPLTMAITKKSSHKTVSKALQQIPLKAIAAYASNQICTAYTNHMTQQTAQALVGGLSGFAQEQTRKGFISGVTGALTAETVGALLIADSQAIAQSASAQLKKKGIKKTTANMQRAIAQEVQKRMNFAKIAAASVAALTHQNPTIAAGAATNAIDNNIAVRGQHAAFTKYQAMVAAVNRNFVILNTPEEMFEAQYQELQRLAQEEDTIEIFNLPDGKKPFVRNPNAGTWFAACISNDLVLAKGSIKGLYLFHRMRWLKHPKCPFTIVAHGNSTSVVLENKNIHPEGLTSHNMQELQEKGKVDLNAYELAELIRTSPDYKEKQHIHLFACQCGSENNGIAQQLANEMEVPVSAFTGNAAISGAFFASVQPSDSWIPTFKTIKTFYPR